VLGGSNIAIHAARSVLRLGGKPLLYYRRSRNEMSACAAEIEEARQEGVEITFHCAPLSIRKWGDDLKLRLLRVAHGKRGKSKRSQGPGRKLGVRSNHFAGGCVVG